MSRFADWLSGLALALGAPGLFIVAFLDSSFISLPEIADILVVWMVTKHKARVVAYVVSAVIGSIAGCLVMHWIGKKGGRAVLKRFSSTNVDRAMASFDRYGVLAIFVPSILPPPMPFRLFVILAGVAGMSRVRLVSALAAGRGVRYAALGFFAVKYGDQAIAYARENALMVALAAVVVLLLGYLVFRIWRGPRTIV